MYNWHIHLYVVCHSDVRIYSSPERVYCVTFSLYTDSVIVQEDQKTSKAKGTSFLRRLHLLVAALLDGQ